LPSCSTLPLFYCRYFEVCRRATRGPGAPACATRGHSAPARATRDLGFTEPPLVYQRLHPAPAPEPSRAGSSVYHPVTVARDPRGTHLMVSRRAVGVTKPVNCLQLPRHCLRSRPLSVALSQTPTGGALWRSTRPCCLTTRGTWFLGLLGPMSSPVSGSLSTSSRRMALLIDTRFVGSSGASLSAPGGLGRDLQPRRQAYHRPDCANSGCL
jgi:hypothetical protein